MAKALSLCKVLLRKRHFSSLLWEMLYIAFWSAMLLPHLKLPETQSSVVSISILMIIKYIIELFSRSFLFGKYPPGVLTDVCFDDTFDKTVTKKIQKYRNVHLHLHNRADSPR